MMMVAIMRITLKTESNGMVARALLAGNDDTDEIKEKFADGETESSGL